MVQLRPLRSRLWHGPYRNHRFTQIARGIPGLLGNTDRTYKALALPAQGQRVGSKWGGAADA